MVTMTKTTRENITQSIIPGQILFCMRLFLSYRSRIFPSCFRHYGDKAPVFINMIDFDFIANERKFHIAVPTVKLIIADLSNIPAVTLRTTVQMRRLLSKSFHMNQHVPPHYDLVVDSKSCTRVRKSSTISATFPAANATSSAVFSDEKLKRREAPTRFSDNPIAKST